MDSFWESRQTDEGFTCPGEGGNCQRVIKLKTSNTAKNPGREFVACSKDFGGCGLFCFLDERPRLGGGGGGKGGASAAKRPRRPGVSDQLTIVENDNVARVPSEAELQLARLQTSCDRIEQQLREIAALLAAKK